MTEVKVDTPFGSAFLRCNFGITSGPKTSSDVFTSFPSLKGCVTASISGVVRKRQELTCEFGFLPHDDVSVSPDSGQWLDAFLFQAKNGHGHFAIRDDEWFESKPLEFVRIVNQGNGRQYVYTAEDSLDIEVSICAAWSVKQFDPMNLDSWLAVDGELAW